MTKIAETKQREGWEPTLPPETERESLPNVFGDMGIFYGYNGDGEVYTTIGKLTPQELY